MREEHSIIGKILAKYPEITEEENQVLDEWLLKDNNREIFNSLTDRERLNADLRRFLQIQEEMPAAMERFQAYIAGKEARANTIKFIRWSAVAAAILMIVSVMYFLNLGKPHKPPVTETPAIVQYDVAPGQFKAKLTLADGSSVVLDSAAKGELVKQGSTTVLNKDGQLVYQKKGKSVVVMYNTLTTDKGQIYATLLSDGSKVWLNSQSSIRYPVAFDGGIRKVEIKGEAYFEVASSPERPFIVSVNGMEVAVTGTHFNINSYDNEPDIKTTLLEGRVQVTKGSDVFVLAPGQEARLNKQSQQLNMVNDVDVDEAVAWRYGYFQFNDADLQTVLRNLVRWYDVTIEFKGAIPEKRFWGKISKTNNLSQVLATLETSGVHFTIQGKKIIVSP
jgi:transmembrane sensor